MNFFWRHGITIITARIFAKGKNTNTNKKIFLISPLSASLSDSPDLSKIYFLSGPNLGNPHSYQTRNISQVMTVNLQPKNTSQLYFCFALHFLSCALAYMNMNS